ncbi:hypothetical protein DPEC_G00255460 [Dallia pectoralis]|uniref:Uncharacterized protein n=1 Tax=Dallia pectoralis TaxID=75939 RepID=A0ACC2FUS6_DALPE|nr:hypothetical protein DPEC_G00255460 [Dallia pectoralis]
MKWHRCPQYRLLRLCIPRSRSVEVNLTLPSSMGSEESLWETQESSESPWENLAVLFASSNFVCEKTMACHHVFFPTIRQSWRVALAASKVVWSWKRCMFSSSRYAPVEPGHQDRPKQTMHTPVMLKEVLRCLDIQPGQGAHMHP